MSPSLVWFRQDLRLEDNPALLAAVELGRPIIPVFIWAPEEHGHWPPGSASRWWLQQSLTALDEELQSFGSRLIVRKGPSSDTLLSLIQETEAKAVFWNRLYEPALANRDQELQRLLQDRVEVVRSFNGNLLFEPEEIRTKKGDPFRVFTPFWKSRQDPREPLPRPKKLAKPECWPASIPLDDLNLSSSNSDAEGLGKIWTPGAKGADRCLVRFLDRALGNYGEARDYPAQPGTSELSPHLHFGEISPHQVWHAVADVVSEGSHVFQTELGWREFAHHVLDHFPRTTDEPLNEKFIRFPWESNAKGLEAWQRGETGFPIVDAGMRQLLETGWMHNRVRMIVASFLTKDLRISWREGARWFWEKLVDADLANNSMGWQWSAGCGADAAPYFRIFNPVRQGEKFDPEGEYVRRFVPELDKLPKRWIHKPWEADPAVLEAAGVKLGRDYPEAIVDHSQARKRALEAFETVKG